MQKEYSKIKVENEEKVALYFTLQSQIIGLKEKIRQYIITPMYLVPFLQVGRMVKVSKLLFVIISVGCHLLKRNVYSILQIKDEQREYDWGIILNFKKRDIKYKNPTDPTSSTITVDVMVPSIKEEDKNSSTMEVISINHTQIVAIGAVRLNCPSDLRTSDNQKSIYKSLQVIF